MKRTLALLLAAMLLLPLAACKITINDRTDPTGTEPADPTTTSYGATDPVTDPALPTMEEALANWAWGVTNGMRGTPVTRIALTGYSLGCDFSKLTLALGPPYGQAGVEYKGEKKGNGGEQFYYPEYECVTGPDFALKAPITVSSYQPPAFLVDLDALQSGNRELSCAYDRETGEYPPASARDLAGANAAKDGRRVVESRVLADVERGGDRVCLFRYENRPDDGLFTIVYFRDDVMLAYDVTTDNVDIEEDSAFWRADAEANDVCDVQPLFLCRTKEGVLLVIAWSAPEGMAELVLREQDGAFVDLDLGGMYYSRWDDKYHSTEDDEW